GRASEAVKVYREALADRPRRAASLLGLARAQDAAGDHTDARATYAELSKRWSHADANVRASLTGSVDPVSVSPDKYKILLENEQARVVDYIIEPGARDAWHTHPPKASYVVSGGTFRITLADSTSFLSEDSTGSASWRGATPLHYARNVGSTSIHVILVEPRTGFALASHEQDPAVVNPSSIRVKLENDSVRVMEAVLPPGFKEKLHHHP